MGRHRRKVRRKRRHNTIKAKCGLHLGHLPLPFGTCIDLSTFTRILLYTRNQNVDDEWNQIRRQLNELDTNMQIFDDIEKCIQYIQQESVEKLYLLVLKSNPTTIENIRETIVNACPSGLLKQFYIFNGQHARVENEAIIINDSEEYENQTLIPMAIYGLIQGQEVSIRDLTNDQIRFIWFQLLIDILLQSPSSLANINDMLEVARTYYSSDQDELKKINEFACSYQRTKAIWWYTNDSFVYRLLNRAFRTQDIRIIFTFRFFILDLYTQLAEEAKSTMSSLPKRACRGQFLPVNELETIKNNIGGLISMNTFVSATIDTSVAYTYAGDGSRLPSHVSVVFDIDLENDNQNSAFERPFASIAKHSSKRDEKEILFSMGTIFRIISVEEYVSVWLICLKIENQVKECLAKLSGHLRNENMHSIASELTLGDFLLHMGELHQAEQFYGIMLHQQVLDDENNIEKALLYNSIGTLHIDRGNYGAAKTLFNQAYAVAKNNHFLKSITFNNLGLAELNQGRYNRGMKYFLLAKKYNRSPKRLASILSNIASVMLEKGQFKIARCYLQRALIGEQKHVPPMHFDLANLYANLAAVEIKMGNYEKSLKLLEKCLSIYRESLPANHHRISHVLNNLGIVYSYLEKYDLAHEYYEQALNILSSSFEQTKSQHLLIAMSLNNLATLQFEQEDLSAAESGFQRVLDIKLKMEGIDSNTHQSLANAYNNLAMVQMKQGHFEEALANFERTLRVELTTGNAANIAITYNNIGGVYDEQNDFIKAKRYYKKARSTALTVLSRNHPNVKLYNENMRKARENIRKKSIRKSNE